MAQVVKQHEHDVRAAALGLPEGGHRGWKECSAGDRHPTSIACPSRLIHAPVRPKPGARAYLAIEHSSPKVHNPVSGEDRRGKIWGGLVPYGLSDLGFGNGKPGPWRAGANQNTVFEVSHPVKMEGKDLPAGRYGLHVIPQPDGVTIISGSHCAALLQRIGLT
ncbi:MAG: DUF2911 domain-containing protein [Acidobacteria bacterium]|nr:DUF2911 domain-containing protein [Acidobacteriota bacterium]